MGSIIIECSTFSNEERTKWFIHHIICRTLLGGMLFKDDLALSFEVGQNLVQSIGLNSKIDSIFNQNSSIIIDYIAGIAECLEQTKIFLSAVLSSPILSVLLHNFNNDEIKIKEIVYVVTKRILMNIKQRINLFPKHLAVLIYKMSQVLVCSNKEVELIQLYFINVLFIGVINPAILSPEKFGIHSDLLPNQYHRSVLKAIINLINYLLKSFKDGNKKQLNDISLNIV